MEIVVAGRTVRFGNSAMAIDRDVPAVVFLHGAGMDHTVWQLQSRYIAHHGYRSIALNFPGHDKSAGPALETVEDMAAWVALVIDELGVAPAHVVGHSMGSLVALELAASSPASVASVILLGVSATMPVNSLLLDAAANNQHLAGELMTDWSHHSDAQIGGHDVPGYWQLASSSHLIDRCPPGTLAVDLAACNAYQGAVEAASKIDVPTTVIVGMADKMSRPKAAEPLIDELSDVSVVEIPNAGHMAMIEDSKAVRDAMMTALASAGTDADPEQ